MDIQPMTFNDDMSREDRIKHVAHFPERLLALVAGYTPEQLTTHYVEGEWSIAQNVHHLADAQAQQLFRYKWTLADDMPTLPHYDAAVWGDMGDSIGADLEESAKIIVGVHGRIVQLLNSLDEEAWARECIHPRGGQINMDGLLWRTVRHGEAHIQQILDVIHAMKEAS